MRLIIALSALFLVISCTATNDSLAPDPLGSTANVDALEKVSTFVDDCESFETIEFGQIEAVSLAGHVLVGAGPPVPLRGVQVAAKRHDRGQVSFTVTSETGFFEIEGLAAGKYEVWTCAEGYDRIQFDLLLESNSATRGIDIYTGPSEAGGRREVVPLTTQPGPST